MIEYREEEQTNRRRPANRQRGKPRTDPTDAKQATRKVPWLRPTLSHPRLSNATTEQRERFDWFRTPGAFVRCFASEAVPFEPATRRVPARPSMLKDRAGFDKDLREAEAAEVMKGEG